MKRWLIILGVAFFVIFATAAQAGTYFYNFYFIGLWQGVDPDDGSEVQRSITLNEDGVFKIVGYETFYSGCDGGRGVVTATGVFENGVILCEDFTLTCLEDELGPFSVPVKYVPDRLNGTLLETYLNGSFQPEVLHKISKR